LLRHATAVISALVALSSISSEGAEGQGTQAQKPGEGVWRNYDFVPGDTVWAATDFTTEPVGRFPASQLQFVRGNMQMVEVDGVKALEISSASVFRLALPRTLPDDFSVEFEIKIPAPNISTLLYFGPPAGSPSAYKLDYVFVGGRPGVYRQGQPVSNLYMPTIQDRWVPVKLQVDSVYAIMYVGSERAAQVPVVNFPRSQALEFHLNGNPRLRTYLRNIVVAVGLNDLYRTLSTGGAFSTLGITFDTDSDRLLPESTPVLQQILTTLNQHADLRIQIEGHTDSQGDDAHNQQLSERRARAVVSYLTEHGIPAARLSASGKGETTPAGDNATAAGRRQNRRVVITKAP
jgi:outer membrane protein OmpA-like peptidoglycan-associated protein